MYKIPDLDIDVKDREDILKYIKHIPASKILNGNIIPHGVGVYFSNVPEDKVSGLCSIDYKAAEEEYGFVKVDLLHNTVIDNFNSRSEIKETLQRKVKWKDLLNKDIVEKLPHINGYYDLIKELPTIDSIEKLAMMIAIVRPGKAYLIDKVKKGGWESIKDIIWVKEDKGYMYKKSHAISYALMITLALNNLE